jgi:hypothetical protein
MQQVVANPPEIIRTLLAQDGAQQISHRTVATLGRRANALVDRAARVGLHVEYLGISPLFDEPRLYRGPKTDWVLGPANRTEDLVVPRVERDRLRRLVEAGVDVPSVYIAHEVPKERTKAHPAEAPTPVVLSSAEAEGLVGPVPSPVETIQTAERLAAYSSRTLKALGAVATAAVTAPAVFLAGAVASLATLDPIVIGAVPLSTARPGAPAAWLALVRWEW